MKTCRPGISPRFLHVPWLFMVVLGFLTPSFSAEMPASVVPPPAGPLDLQQVYELAVLQSETLGMKEEDIRVAQARYWQSIGEVFPKVHLLGSQQWQNSSISSSSSTSSDSNKKEKFESRVHVRLPLFNGFRDYALIAATHADAEAARQQRARALQLLYLDCGDVFHQVLMYAQDAKLLTEIRDILGKRVTDLENRVRLGKTREGDLLMARSRLADMEVTLSQTEGLLQSTRELLAFLTGIPSGKLNLKSSSSLPAAGKLEKYLEHTGERPDVLSAIQEERAAVKRLSATRGEHWPSVNAEANYYLAERPSSPREWNILITADFPLFEGGIIQSKVHENRALHRSAEINLDLIRRTAEREARVAYIDFIAALAQYARLQEAVVVHQRNWQVQQEDFKVGISTSLEVMDALEGLLDARRRLNATESECHLQMIRLLVAGGTLIP